MAIFVHSPGAGDIEVTGETLTIAADPGITIIAYTVEPLSPSAEAPSILASWTSGNAENVSRND